MCGWTPPYASETLLLISWGCWAAQDEGVACLASQVPTPILAGRWSRGGMAELGCSRPGPSREQRAFQMQLSGVSLNNQFPSALQTVLTGKGKKEEGWQSAGPGTKLPWGAAPHRHLQISLS